MAEKEINISEARFKKTFRTYFRQITNDIDKLGNYTCDASVFSYKSKQPLVEKRHDLLKNTLEVTPAFLKSISRLEAFLFLNYVGVTVHALIERELRNAMEDRGLKSLRLYPEDRNCPAPTVARIIEAFGNLQSHTLSKAGKDVQRFHPELTDLQKQIIKLVGVSPCMFAVDA